MQLLSVTFFLASIFLASAVDRQYISANGTFANRRDYDSISVKNGGQWGVWTWIDKCPPGSYAIGFSIRVEEYRGASDDTSLNGIRLFCSTEQTSNIMYTVESEPGEYGHWSGIRWCPRNGILRSFQLKVEPEQGAGDDTAVNNIRFRCSNGLQIEEAGGPFGEYSEWSTPCERGGICGLQTKQEHYQGFFIDDTALNDVRFFCCE
ncbi:vitelline membrane outer layer protein 1 homolog [Ahaetulla prasina]|uniref:vitelline membrane outer layer protein 1 homolog n=1 Tax=Ahaetulla prasina TaxID=499056 RepID=UPI002649FA34|nr:vitelline membrane outer layer protein 1 homolog [Ahaetulla prasina]